MHRTMFVTGGAGIPCGSSEQQRGGVCGCEELGTTARNGGGNGACRKENRKKKKNIFAIGLDSTNKK